MQALKDFWNKSTVNKLIILSIIGALVYLVYVYFFKKKQSKAIGVVA